MQKQAAILERTEWAEKPDVWHGEFEGKRFGTNVSVMFYTTEHIGRGPRLHKHPYDRSLSYVRAALCSQSVTGSLRL